MRRLLVGLLGVFALASMLGVGLIQVACAIAAWRLLDGWPAAALAVVLLSAIEIAAERAARPRAVAAPGA